MVYRMAPSNQTRPEAEGFLHVTQVLLIISCAIIAPIFAIETWGFMQFVKGYFATSQARRGREFNRENIMLRVFLLLQNIIAFALVAQMAVPLYSIPWPSALNCDVFVILIW